jgi:hypothetical protein
LAHWKCSIQAFRARMDRMGGDIELIKRRLDLADA